METKQKVLKVSQIKEKYPVGVAVVYKGFNFRGRLLSKNKIFVVERYARSKRTRERKMYIISRFHGRLQLILPDHQDQIRLLSEGLWP